MTDAGFTIIECGITSDIRPGRAEEKWVNVIVKKDKSNSGNVIKEEKE